MVLFADVSPVVRTKADPRASSPKAKPIKVRLALRGSLARRRIDQLSRLQNANDVLQKSNDEPDARTVVKLGIGKATMNVERKRKLLHTRAKDLPQFVLAVHMDDIVVSRWLKS